MKITVSFYKLPLDNIPFSKIRSLENIVFKNVLVKLTPLNEINGMDICLIGVYNIFDNEIDNKDKCDSSSLLFGEVLGTKFKTRGKDKSMFLCSKIIELNRELLPKLKYTPDEKPLPISKWFFTSGGNYFILSAKKSTYEYVKNFETLSIYSESLLRLRIVLELLKLNIKKGIVKITLEDFYKIGYLVLRSEVSYEKISDMQIRLGVKKWVDEILFIPLKLV